MSLIFVIRNWSGASYIEYKTVLNVKGLDPCHSDFSATCMRRATRTQPVVGVPERGCFCQRQAHQPSRVGVRSGTLTGLGAPCPAGQQREADGDRLSFQCCVENARRFFWACKCTIVETLSSGFIHGLLKGMLGL